MKKILIVEDNEINRELIREILIYNGFEVIESGNGEDGVKMAKKHKPALILMDIQMPVMSGIKAIRLLKDDAETKNIKIIAVTSFAMKGERENIIKEGFDGYISKPINTRELPAFVKRFLE